MHIVKVATNTQKNYNTQQFHSPRNTLNIILKKIDI